MKKTKLGQELIAGLTEAITHEQGKQPLRTTTLEIPEPAKQWRRREIARLRREQFKLSQEAFARVLSVTASTIRAWEQGLKTPSGAANRLLELASFDPAVFERLAKEKRRA